MQYTVHYWICDPVTAIYCGLVGDRCKRAQAFGSRVRLGQNSAVNEPMSTACIDSRSLGINLRLWFFVTGCDLTTPKLTGVFSIRQN